MQTSTADPYDVLGVPATASLAQIKLAFRKMASTFHPDRNPDAHAAARFRDAQHAYEILSDEERRRECDQRRQKHLLDDSRAAARSIFQSYLEGIA
jgi:DnaJ-class molecular chaperone